ncbi:MAG TPA: TetR family transcriptional regulator [Trebonia sp.]|nr:TetR family transcriptional regulator [Trebonia sp.]
MTDVDLPQHTSLRERKKARTRAAIREHALRLFREQGYDATTVEQIAAAAEVSPSTFFRYFPTKEDVVLQDGFDDLMFEAFDRQPPSLSPVAALRAAMRETIATFTPAEWAEFQEMSAIGMSVPEVRARMMDEMSRMIETGTDAVAKRTGRSPADLAVRVYTGAVIGAIMAVMGPEAYREGTVDAEAFGRIDEALAVLEPGLPEL